MDTRVYRSIHGPFLGNSTSHHYNVPCHNLVCLEKIAEVPSIPPGNFFENIKESNENRMENFPFYHSFKYKTDICTVLYPGRTKTDRAHDYVFRKLLWYKKLLHYMPENFEKSMRQLRKHKSLNIKDTDRKLSKFLQWLSFEQDDKFIGNYNWLYTGGNITGFKCNKEYWIITPDEFEQSTFLCITKLTPNFNPLWRSNERPMRINLHNNQPVHQIISKTKTDYFFLAVRHKDIISVKKLNDDCEIMDVWDLRTFKINSSSNYITTCDLSNDCRYITLVTSDCDMTAFDVEVEMPVFSCRQDWNYMQWSRVLFDKGANEIYLTDSCYFKTFDLRAGNEPSFVYTPTAVTTKCEKIRNVFESEFRDNIFYIATSHQIIEVDIRTGKNLQRWTHMMEYAPQFGGTMPTENEELITLQSQDLTELIGIHNEGLCKKFPYSRTSPYLFSSAKDELKGAHLNGCGLHEKVNQRLNFKITGLHVATSTKGRKAIFTVNGGGDVFMTKLKEIRADDAREETDYCISLESKKGFNKFEKRCCELQTEKKRENRATPSTFIDFSSLLSLFQDVKVEERRRQKRSKGLCHYWVQSELYSPDNLSYFEGGYCERFLPCWGIKLKSFENEEEDASGSENENEKLLESRAKVENWMN